MPLSWRASRAEIDYCIDDAAAELVWAEQDGSVRAGDTTFTELLESDEHPGALDTDEQADSLMLYTSGTTGKPKGVPRSHCADRAGSLSQVVQHGLEDGDRTLGAMPLYHTMGMHLLLAMSLIGGTAHWAGPVVGAILLGATQQLLTVTISSEVNVLVLGVMLVLFVVAAPEGIIGLIRRVLRNRSEGKE